MKQGALWIKHFWYTILLWMNQLSHSKKSTKLYSIKDLQVNRKLYPKQRPSSFALFWKQNGRSIITECPPNWSTRETAYVPFCHKNGILAIFKTGKWRGPKWSTILARLPTDLQLDGYIAYWRYIFYKPITTS